MTVLSVYETGRGRRLRDDAEEDSGIREFIVITDDITDGPAVAKTADDGVRAIPAMGAQHDDNAGINVSNIDPQPTENRLVWMVIVEYSGAEGISTSSPTNEPWGISWGFENSEELVVQAQADTTALGAWGTDLWDPIENIVGDPFDPPPTETKARLVCTLTKNKSTFDVDQAAVFINNMNNAAVDIAGYTAPKWCAKLIEYSATKMKRGTTDYWEVKYRVLFDDTTFIREILNAGWNKLVGGDPVEIKQTLDGSPPTVAQKLDDAGALTDTAYYWSFATVEEATFSALGLPTTM